MKHFNGYSILTVSLWIIILGFCMTLCCSCTLLWTDDAFYASFMKEVDFDEVIRDANSLTIRKYKGNPDDITIVTPYGAVESKGD